MVQLEGDISTNLTDGVLMLLKVRDDETTIGIAATLDDLVMRFGLFHITATWSYSDVRVELPLHGDFGQKQSLGGRAVRRDRAADGIVQV